VAPTVDQILAIKRAGSPEISSDGRWVAYTIRQTNWDDNAYEHADLACGHVDRRLSPADQRQEVESVADVVA
jgi:hypothetical protein